MLWMFLINYEVDYKNNFLVKGIHIHYKILNFLI